MFTLLGLRLFIPILLSVYFVEAQNYVPSEALVEPLKPVGIRISVPDEEGIRLVAFHVKFNEDFEGLEAGTIARDIIKQRNGRWTYQDKSTRLKSGDVIYYWIHVVYNGLGYNLVDQAHTVTDFYDYNGQKIEPEGNEGQSGQPDQPGQPGQPCVESVTKLYDSTGMSQPSCVGQLLFQEDFRDLSQFKKKWTTVEQFSNIPDYEFVVYRDSDKNLQVQNGLKIEPHLLSDDYSEAFVREGNLTLSKCTGYIGSVECYRQAQGWNILPPVTSGRINTKKNFNFEYGRIEIRAKLPRGDWIYPLLLLEPVKKPEEQPPQTIQMRIASAVGNTDLKLEDGRDISGHVLWGGVTGMDRYKTDDRFTENRATKYNRQLWSDSFHVYELIWSPNRVILKADGQGYNDEQINISSQMPFYLTLGVAVGGVSEFPDNCKSHDNIKPWRNSEAKAHYNFFHTTNTWHRTWQQGATSLEVDYVKVWAL